MDGTYLSELDDELVQTDGLLSNSMDGLDPSDLAAQRDLIPNTAEELEILQNNQRSASVAGNPLLASNEQSTVTEGNRDRQTSPVPSLSQFPNDFEQREEIITGIRQSEIDERLLRRALEDNTEILEATFGGQYYLPAHDEITDSRSTNILVEDFVRNLPCVMINSLGLDNQKCSICLSEYGKERGNYTESEHVIPGQDLREFPVELPCGHVFGDWCISIWLRDCQPPTCPMCRSPIQLTR